MVVQILQLVVLAQGLAVEVVEVVDRHNAL